MGADVLIILGSKSDIDVAKKAAERLKALGIEYKVEVASAHRTPQRVEKLVKESGAKVFIAIAGLSAALPGAIAAHTVRPVIGVPVSGKVNLDAILSIVQMPPGVPVAAVGVDMGENAAILAAQILAVDDKALSKRLSEFRDEMARKVEAASREVGGI
ncbi:MAG: 5-(carboxyamino)imidazole ribonucleotide mutase [Euryarchaeota archaeon]|nr:5-(carboxyamino)imidazole ribonucleotide mutase [Euryarchaeota archaeon]